MRGRRKRKDKGGARRWGLRRRPINTIAGAPIDGERTELTDCGDRSRHAVVCRRDEDEMHVIGHETISLQTHIVRRQVLLQNMQIKDIVFVTEKRRLAPISALCHMVGQSCENDTCGPRHERLLARSVFMKRSRRQARAVGSEQNAVLLLAGKRSRRRRHQTLHKCSKKWNRPHSPFTYSPFTSPKTVS
ncbi:MAG: hypothetical protein NW203_11340, partial [Hyphomonadaceae bacterium]|nr:hypothetical protein [Hyphomonadaceae bacterium]